MHWIDLDREALAAMVKGDEDRAIALWTEAITTIQTIQPEPTVEVGQVYYRLGKCLAIKKDYERAISMMQTAEDTIFEADPGNELFEQLRYDLGATLSQAGRAEEAEITIKKAMGIVSAPLADCLVGPKDDDVSIRQLVTILQEMGLASKLNKREFTRIKKAIIKAERGTMDDDSIHPHDLFYTYYLPEERRRADKVVLFQNFEPQYDLPTLIKDMNIVLDMVVFLPKDVVSVDEGCEDQIYYLIVDPDDGPMAARLQPGDEWDELVCAVNSKLMHLGDPRRFLRLAKQDGREQGLLLLDKDQAVSLYRAGAGYIFENLSADLEPQPPLLVPLKVPGTVTVHTIKALLPTKLTSFEAIAEALKQYNMRLEDEILIADFSSIICKLEVFETNDDWLNTMQMGRTLNPFNQQVTEELAQTSLFVNFESPADCDQNREDQSTIALDSIQFIHRLMQALSAPAVLMRSSNNTHTFNEFSVFARTSSAQNLVHAFSRLYNFDDILTVAGMDALGYPNIEIPVHILGLEASIELIHEICVELVKREEPVGEGLFTYKSRTTAKDYELELIQTTPTEDSTILKCNPLGVLKLKRIVAV